MNKIKLVGEEKKEREIKEGDLFSYGDGYYMLVEIKFAGNDSIKYQLIHLSYGKSVFSCFSLEDFIDYYEDSDFIRLKKGESVQITPDLDR